MITARKRNPFFIGVWTAALHTLTFSVGVNLFKEVTPMRNKTKDTARKEESHAEASDGQRRHAPL